jgi:pteridine reductase
MTDRRVALVTGAGRRIGQAIAAALGARGYMVAIHYNTAADGAAETLRLVRQAGGDGALFHADLTSPDAPAALVQAVLGAMGALDVLVNSAAGMERTPLGTITAEQWDRVFALNTRAPALLAQAAAPALRSRAGCIVNIADLAAFESWPAYMAHGASKAALVHLTATLARVMAPEVRVNAVAPGAVLLPGDWDADAAARLAATTPLGRIGNPDDVVGAVLYLLDAPFVTGQTITVDGGRRIRT